jgi:chromosomal replication initiator protein
MENFEAIWQKTSGKLKNLLNEDTYDRWISGIVPLGLEQKTCRLGVSNDIFCEWLGNNYRELMTSALEEELGFRCLIEFVAGHESSRPPAKSEGGAREKKQIKTGTEKPVGGFNHRFVFDTFVVGENNKFSHAACCAVAKCPGKAYNPLFIHGGTGLGKTHLLQAIAQEVLGRRKKARISYLSSEEFANIYIDALRDRALPAFRQHYRNLDLLLIDDVQFFTGKEQLQEEFFHTFNALYNTHKQIVMTSDRPPHEIGGLEKRLVSRFEWGLTTEIMSPNLETRVAILRKKQAEHVVKIDDEVLFFVASRIRSNIRRLEGALIRLVSYASITETHIDQAMAEQLLRPLLEEENVGNLSVGTILEAVAKFYDIRLADMTSKKRPQSIAFPRQVAMFLCRKLTDFSSPAIAESFNRNHATVLHAVGAIEKRMADNADLRSAVAQLEKKLKG